MKATEADAIGPAVTPSTPSKPAGRIGARKEAVAGYAFISLPDAHVPVPEHRGRSSTRPTSACGTGTSAQARSTSWASTTTPASWATPLFQTAVKNTLYYAIIWVPLTMAIGLFLAIVVNQKIHGKTFFRAAFYFPALASSAAITDPVDFPDRARRPVQRGARGSWSEPASSACSASRPPRTGSAITTRRSTRSSSSTPGRRRGTFMLFYLASLQSDPVRGVRGGGDRRRQHVADVPLDHLSAAAPGPLLRRDRRLHRRAAAVRPVVHRRRPRRRARQLADDDRAVPLQPALQADQLGLCRGRGHRALRDHLQCHPRPAPPVRRQPDGLSAT